MVTKFKFEIQNPTKLLKNDSNRRICKISNICILV